MRGKSQRGREEEEGDSSAHDCSSVGASNLYSCPTVKQDLAESDCANEGNGTADGGKI